MKCTNCGADLLEGARFCTKCGTSVVGKIQPTPTVNPAMGKPQQPKNYQPMNQPLNQPKNQQSVNQPMNQPMNQQSVNHRPVNPSMTQPADPINSQQQEKFQSMSNEQPSQSYYNNGEVPQTYGKKSSGGIIAAIVVIVILVIVIAVLGIMILMKNGKSDEAGDSTQNVTEATTDADSSTDTEQDSEQTGENIFDKIPSSYLFCSGVGGWGTEIDINSDGTFSGSYHDSDMGSSGPGYDSTLYYCNFSGKFSTPKKVNDYTYSMNVEYLDTEGTLNEEEIRDRTRYITSEPYGLENADEVMIYLPGAKMSELPEGFVQWTSAMASHNSNSDYVDYYGLFNVKDGYGFYNSEHTGTTDYTVENDASSEYIISDSDSRILTDADVDGLELWQINYAKNEIYARHGYIFESNELQNYFNSKSWYRPLYAKKEFNSLGLLSSVENKNAAFLSKKEKERGGYKLD